MMFHLRKRSLQFFLGTLTFGLILIFGGSPVHATAPSVRCEESLVQEGAEQDLRVLSARAFAAKISPDRLKLFIEYLNGETELPGGLRLLNRREEANREVVRQSIAMKLRDMGFRPEFEAFSNPTGANVVVEIPGASLSSEVVELSAHFDTIARGADDNAAGVALLIHLAELMKLHPPERTIRMVFSDLEEVDCDGICHHLLQIKEDPRKFLGALVVDSIGYFPSGPEPRITAEIGPGDLALPLSRELFYQTRRLPLDRGLIFSAELENVDGESADHGPYWKAGRPAILFARPFGEKFDSPYNHGQHDTVRNMNWDYYTKAARLFAEVVGFAGRIQLDAEVARNVPESTLENREFRLAVEGQSLPDPEPIRSARVEEEQQQGQQSIFNSTQQEHEEKASWWERLMGLIGKP